MHTTVYIPPHVYMPLLAVAFLCAADDVLNSTKYFATKAAMFAARIYHNFF